MGVKDPDDCRVATAQFALKTYTQAGVDLKPRAWIRG